MSTILQSPRDLGFPDKFQDFRHDVQQREIILDIATTDFSSSVLCAPTGSGKTLIYVAAAVLRGDRTLIYVANKALAAQLSRDLSEMGLYELHGHSSYPCFDSWSGECKAAHGECLYLEACAIARERDLVLTNYDHGATMAKNGTMFRLGHFDCVVCDEAHTAHDILARQLTSTISSDQLTKIDINHNLPNGLSVVGLIDWYKEFLPVLLNYLAHDDPGFVDAEDYGNDSDDIPTKSGKGFATLGGSKRIQNERRRLLREVRFIVQNATPNNWLISQYKELGFDTQYTISPIWADRYFKRYILNNCNRSIFASATISRQSVQLLGIDKNDMLFREVLSSFPVQRRPFYYLPVLDMSYRSTPEQRYRLYSGALSEWLRARLHHKGLIQSVSYDRAIECVDGIAADISKYVHHHKGTSALRAMEVLLAESAPYVSCSPSFVAGFDLPGDHCRHQALIKVPFPDRRDPIIDARAKSRSWYTGHIAATAITQMYGRDKRSKDDWSEVIMFDRMWGKLARDAWFPLYFRRAWKKIDVLPEPLTL